MDGNSSFTSPFIGSLDGAGAPVCPVEVVLEHRDGKGVRQLTQDLPRGQVKVSLGYHTGHG